MDHGGLGGGEEDEVELHPDVGTYLDLVILYLGLKELKESLVGPSSQEGTM